MFAPGNQVLGALRQEAEHNGAEETRHGAHRHENSPGVVREVSVGDAPRLRYHKPCYAYTELRMKNLLKYFLTLKEIKHQPGRTIMPIFQNTSSLDNIVSLLMMDMNSPRYENTMLVAPIML